MSLSLHSSSSSSFHHRVENILSAQQENVRESSLRKIKLFSVNCRFTSNYDAPSLLDYLHTKHALHDTLFTSNEHFLPKHLQSLERKGKGEMSEDSFPSASPFPSFSSHLRHSILFHSIARREQREQTENEQKSQRPKEMKNEIHFTQNDTENNNNHKEKEKDKANPIPHLNDNDNADDDKNHRHQQQHVNVNIDIIPHQHHHHHVIDDSDCPPDGNGASKDFVDANANDSLRYDEYIATANAMNIIQSNDPPPPSPHLDLSELSSGDVDKVIGFAEHQRIEHHDASSSSKRRSSINNDQMAMIHISVHNDGNNNPNDDTTTHLNTNGIGMEKESNKENEMEMCTQLTKISENDHVHQQDNMWGKDKESDIIDINKSNDTVVDINNSIQHQRDDIPPSSSSSSPSNDAVPSHLHPQPLLSSAISTSSSSSPPSSPSRHNPPALPKRKKVRGKRLNDGAESASQSAKDYFSDGYESHSHTGMHTPTTGTGSSATDTKSTNSAVNSPRGEIIINSHHQVVNGEMIMRNRGETQNNGKYNEDNHNYTYPPLLHSQSTSMSMSMGPHPSPPFPPSPHPPPLPPHSSRLFHSKSLGKLESKDSTSSETFYYDGDGDGDGDDSPRRSHSKSNSLFRTPSLSMRRAEISSASSGKANNKGKGKSKFSNLKGMKNTQMNYYQSMENHSNPNPNVFSSTSTSPLPLSLHVKSGWLQIRSSNLFFSSWRKVFVTISGEGIITIQETNKSKNPHDNTQKHQQNIDLGSSAVQLQRETKYSPSHPFVFTLHLLRVGQWTLESPSYLDLQQWMETIQLRGKQSQSEMPREIHIVGLENANRNRNRRDSWSE